MRSGIGAFIVLMLCVGTAWAGPPQRGIVAPWGEDAVLIDYGTAGGGGAPRGGGVPGLQAAADHIVGQQCPNGGWGWPHDDCGATYNNITGPIALGLLQAYEMTADADHLTSATDGGDYDLTFQYGNGEARFGSFTPFFMHKLTAATSDSTYSTFAETGFFDELTAGTHGPDDVDTTGYLDVHKAARSGALINIRSWDMQYMPWVAGQIGNSASGPSDAVDQQARFLEYSVLDGLNTLDDTDPNNIPWDITGLAGAVHGLALNGTTSFPAIVSPNCSAINGITTLCALADVLAGYQNANGSWYWSSNLASPTASDEDTQNTAYSVMALVAAQGHGCGPYDDEIADGRDWLWSMQDTDGGYFSYPGGDHNTEVEGEVLSAMTAPPEVWVDDDYCDGCANDGHAWGYDAFDNIQDGIDAVEGSTVNVAAGMYNERLTIDKSLDLRGAQYGVDPTAPGARTTPAAESIIDITGLSVQNPNVAVEIPSGVTDVTLSGFTVIGSPTSHYADESNIRCWDDNLTIEDNILDGFVGVLYKGADGLIVSRNRVTANKTGIIAQPGTTTNATISDNLLTLGSSPAGDESAIYMTSTSNSSVMGNTATGWINGKGVGGSNLTNVEVSGNTFTGNKDAVSFWGTTTFVDILGNDLSGNTRYGISIKGQDIAIEENDLSGNGDVGVNVAKHVLDTERVSLWHNDLGGSTNFGLQVDGAVTETVDAEENYWGTIGSAGVAAEVTGLADFDPWCNADFTVCTFTSLVTDTYVDDDYVALPDGAQVDWPYTGCTPCGTHYVGYDAFDNIQDGIDAVEGSTVHVAAGTYHNDIVDGHWEGPTWVYDHRIDKSITLLGAQAGVDPAGSTSARPGGESILTRSDGLPYSITAPNVVVDGFMNGSAAANSGGRFIIGDDADGTSIRHTIIQNTPSGSSGHGVYVYPGAVDATVEYCTIANTAWEGISTDGQVTIAHNTIKDIPSSKGIYVGGGNALIDHNAISNTFYEGVIVNGQATISNNDIDTAYKGISVTSSGSATITANTVSNTTYEGVVVAGNSIVTGNDIFGAYHGMQVRGNGTAHTIEGNYIHDNDYHGIEIPNYSGEVVATVSIANNTITDNPYVGVKVGGNTDGSGYHINYNSFSGNGIYGVESSTTAAVDASTNWWGHLSGPAGVGVGSGDAATANVDFTPWIHEGTDQNLGTIGYEPDLSELHVDDTSPQTPGQPGRIQEGIDLVEGSTVYVANGTYTGPNTITSGITITGESESGVIVEAANAQTGSANTFTINASGYDVSLQQMTIRHGDYGIRSSAGNVDVLHCTFYHNGWDGTPYPTPYTQAGAAAHWAAYATDGGAMRIENSGGSEIAHCTLYENDRGIRYQDGANGDIHDNNISTTIQAGIYLAASSYTGATGCTNTAVYDNQSNGNYEHGLLSIGGLGNSFTSNTCNDNWNTGIMLWHPAEITVQGNGFDGNNAYEFNGAGNSADASGTIYADGDADAAGATFAFKLLGNDILNGGQGDQPQADGAHLSHPLPATGIEIMYNTFGGHDIDVHVLDQAATTVVNNNNFLNNSVGIQNDDTSAIVDGENNNWGSAEGPEDTAGTTEIDASDCDTVAVGDMLNVAPAGSLGKSVSEDVDYCPWLIPAQLTLNVDDTCNEAGVGGTVTVYIDLSNVDPLGNDIVGGDFFLSYDNAVLDFINAAPAASIFTMQVYEYVDEGAGTIDYATGVPYGGSGTQSDTTMAVITFTALAEICDTANLVTFRSHTPPTKLSDEFANAAYPALTDLAAITIDGTAPVLSGCPTTPITVECDAVPAAATVTANDNCAGAVSVTYEEVRTDGTCDDYYTLTRTWSAEDDCENSASCTQVITVQDTTPPDISNVPANATVECDSVPTEPSTLPASDNCDTTVTQATYDGETIAAGSCDQAYTITRTWTAVDRCGNSTTETQIITVQDTTAPAFDQACPLPAITVYADAGSCEAAGSTVSATTPTATDNCDPSPAVTFSRDDGKANLTDPYEAADSPITITWTAEDDCTNAATCTQTVTVLAYNELVVDIALDGAGFPGSLTRCITFELWECPDTVPTEIVDLELTFSSGVCSDTVEIPCGNYACITARDTLHTLRRTIMPTTSGTQFVADFAAAGQDLIGGNFNDDFWIDILDFGVFTWQWGEDYGSGDTDCSTPYPHADATGDGIVGTGDFGFIQINYLEGADDNCCGQPGLVRGGDGGPTTEISVEDLQAMGLGHLTIGDLNGDGWLDQADIVAFFSGVRPKPGVVPVEDVMRSSLEPGAPAEDEPRP